MQTFKLSTYLCEVQLWDGGWDRRALSLGRGLGAAGNSQEDDDGGENLEK
jgi:hypothetical protein